MSDEEKEGLMQLARSRTRGAGLVRRAQIIVLAVEGLSAPRIAATMDLGGDTVRFWLKRFNEGGLAGLQEAVRSGPAVRLLDAGPPGRLPERARHRHAAQPHPRNPAR